MSRGETISELGGSIRSQRANFERETVDGYDDNFLSDTESLSADGPPGLPADFDPRVPPFRFPHDAQPTDHAFGARCRAATQDPHDRQRQKHVQQQNHTDTRPQQQRMDLPIGKIPEQRVHQHIVNHEKEGQERHPTEFPRKIHPVNSCFLRCDTTRVVMRCSKMTEAARSVTPRVTKRPTLE